MTADSMTDLRLYLDTADLIMIGDGKEDPAVVRELFAQCERLDVLLVASLWHVADARNAPVDARDRIIGAIDTFPRRALTRLDDDGELVLLPIPSLKQVLDENGEDVQTILDQANNAVGIEQSAPPRGNVPLASLNLGKKLLLEVMTADTKEESLRLAQAFIHKNRRKIATEQTDEMLQVVERMWSVREQLEPLGIWTPDVLTDALTKAEVAKAGERPIGKHVGVLVDQRRRAQLDRRYQSGDLADRNHVEYAPYMDIYTGDHDICTWLVEWRSKLTYERPVVPISNRNLRKVVEELQAR